MLVCGWLPQTLIDFQIFFFPVLVFQYTFRFWHAQLCFNSQGYHYHSRHQCPGFVEFHIKLSSEKVASLCTLHDPQIEHNLEIFCVLQDNFALGQRNSQGNCDIWITIYFQGTQYSHGMQFYYSLTSNIAQVCTDWKYLSCLKDSPPEEVELRFFNRLEGFFIKLREQQRSFMIEGNWIKERIWSVLIWSWINCVVF